MTATRFLTFCWLLALALPAAAQSSSSTTRAEPPKQPVMLDKTQPTRISVTFRLQVDIAANNPAAENTAMESGRKLIYAMALKECSIITDLISEVECGLQSLQLTVQVDNPTQRQSSTLIANANYTLKMKQ